MAWTTPSSPMFTVGQVVTAVQMNQLSDDLRYLKGTDGAVTIDSTEYCTLGLVISGLAGVPTGGVSAGQIHTAGPNAGFNLWRRTLGSFPGGLANGDLLTAYNAAGDFRVNNFGVGDIFFAGRDGRLGAGLNSTNPQGPIHALGNGGGFIFLSANAVDGTLQTLAIAGTVTQSAAFWGYDRNNTSAAFVQISGNMIALGGSFAFTNTDTVTVSVTAGGAITVQRTVGSNGTHQVNLIILYK